MRNPVRRNRNIGTAKQGHGQDNSLEIPESWRDSSVYYEKLVSPVKVRRSIHGKEIIFLVEPTLSDYQHPCTIDDIQRLSEYLPPEDLRGIDIFVLRQPTRKQAILKSLWGRIAYFYEANNCSGVAVILEAQEIDKPLKWSKSLCPEDQLELRRLEKDGHKVTLLKRHVEIDASIDHCRNTQLFRTIPHEVGHYVQYLKVDNDERYDSIPTSEKESFAHRYADDFRSKLEKVDGFPFPRIVSEEGIRSDGLQLGWFCT